MQKHSLIDLHSHTNASDGALTPEELVQRALRQHLTHLAITDHDSVQGLSAAHEAVLSLDAGDKLQIIDGIEISTSYASHQIHIAGLFIDPGHESMQRLVSEQKELRRDRAERIGRKLEKLGFDNIYETIKAGLPEGAVITRGNYSRYLYEIGAAKSTDEAFNRYLRRGKEAYVATQWRDIADAVKIIHEAGGCAVLAHPRRYVMTNTKLRELIAYFKSSGGDAMEVASCQQKPSDRDYLCNLCLKYDLLASAGSDFHQEGQFRELGYNLVIPDKVKPVWAAERFAGRFAPIAPAPEVKSNQKRCYFGLDGCVS